MTSDELIRRIDFKLLKEQKRSLVKLLAKLLSQESPVEDTDDFTETLDGIINFISSVQDFAVDEMGYDEYEVFHLTNGNT